MAPFPTDVPLFTREREVGTVPDLAASFDGEDDVIIVPLPSWCQAHQSVGVVWIDFWMRYQGTSSSYLVEALSGDNIELRWLIEAHGDDLYFSLIYQPGASQHRVQQWGPLAKNMRGVWHHVTFTIRTTPVLSEQLVSSMLLVQSFCFLDFMQVPGSAAESGAVSINRGISRLIVGGTASGIAHDSQTRFFKGEIDDWRLWWRSCPISTDPSACDPYSFVLPRLKDGTSAPAARRADGRHVHLKDVEFDDIALPIRGAYRHTVEVYECSWNDSGTPDLLMYVQSISLLWRTLNISRPRPER